MTTQNITRQLYLRSLSSCLARLPPTKSSNSSMTKLVDFGASVEYLNEAQLRFYSIENDLKLFSRFPSRLLPPPGWRERYPNDKSK
jgi:hypothetical protein